QIIIDTEMKVQGVKALSNALGPVAAERFLTLILKEPFDYTEWQKDHFKNVSIRSLSQRAMSTTKCPGGQIHECRTGKSQGGIPVIEGDGLDFQKRLLPVCAGSPTIPVSC